MSGGFHSGKPANVLMRRDHIASLNLRKMLKIVPQAAVLACIIRNPSIFTGCPGF